MFNAKDSSINGTCNHAYERELAFGASLGFSYES